MFLLSSSFHPTSLSRVVTATRDIPKGEVIFSEKPLNRGPKISGKPVCLGCYRVLGGADILCPMGELLC